MKLRFYIFLALTMGTGCQSYELLVEGDRVAVGGRALVDATGHDGNCIAIVGDPCTLHPDVTDAWVVGDEALVLDGDDDTYEIEGRTVGTARLVAELLNDGRTVRRHIDVPVVDAVEMRAFTDTDSLDETSRLLVSGETFEFRTALYDTDRMRVTGDGLHELTDTDALLVLDETGGENHRIVAGDVAGTTTLVSLHTGESLFEVTVVTSDDTTN